MIQTLLATSVPTFSAEHPVAYWSILTLICSLGAAVVFLTWSVFRRCKTEAALRESEKHYRDIWESAVVGMFQSTPEGRYLAVNPALAKICGYETPADFLRMQADVHRQLYLDSGRPREFRRILSSQESVLLFESEIHRRDGTVIWISENARPVRDPQGRIRYYEGTVVEITERKTAEERLRRSMKELRSTQDDLQRSLHLHRLTIDELQTSQERLNLALEAAKDGIYDWKVQTGEVYFSPRCFRMLDYQGPPSTHTLENWIDLIHPEDLDATFQTLVEHAHTRRDAFTFTMRMKAHSGEWRWLENRGMAVSHNGQGRPDRVVGTLTDISERKKLEEKMRHAQKLESLGVLAGGIAHDFNNLLTGILGNADLALMTLAEDAPIRENILQIEKISRHAAVLTQQMLAYSGKGRFVLQSLDLNSLVMEMSGLLEHSISKKCVLHCELAEDLPPIEVDAAQLRQVVMNLILNAADAIGDQVGVIRIATGALQGDPAWLVECQFHEEATPGPFVYFEVSDTGCGMSEETLSRIFDPFFTTKFTGRGLGLAAVLGIVRGHKGAIRIYSNIGEGTRFIVLFPVPENVAGASAPAEEETAAEAAFHGTVLLVDDEEPVREMTGKMLIKMGFSVVHAGNGIEALNRYRNTPSDFSLILLDLTMPLLGGEETLREIREIHQQTPVILFSGYNIQEAFDGQAGLSADEYLQKPFSFNDLKSTIAKTLRPQ